jgi:UPF0271 protein
MSGAGRSVDLNADLGEGSPGEEELIGLVTSANIACGGHAGDAGSMRASVAAALTAGAAVGAHPGYDDPENFGRRELALSPAAVRGLILRQVGALREIARPLGAGLTHVKPHGALYNQAARDPALAVAIAAAVRELDPGLILVGLAGSELVLAGAAAGLQVAQEAFADRTYQADGSLTPRTAPQPFVAGEEAAVAQVLGMVADGTVRATDGTWLAVRADTVCLHGDDPRAAAFARRLRAALGAAGIAVAPVRAR